VRATHDISLAHLRHLSSGRGLVEFARGDEPDPSAGYCTDDAGRLLDVASRLPRDAQARDLALTALGFLEGARDGAGFQLRQRRDGTWTDDPPSDDATGRALHGLGTAAARSPWPDVRARALSLFDQVAAWRSPWPRATAHAALGAVALLASRPAHDGARRVVADAAKRLPRAASDPAWPWPEKRLTYANALLPDALLAVGVATDDDATRHQALDLLAWLVRQQTFEDHLSFVPTGGRGSDDPRPGFDQQPIEPWTLADACARARRVTGSGVWAEHVAACVSWFNGDNDARLVMWDPATGAGFDGLSRDHVNANRGAESTLAVVATMLAWSEVSPHAVPVAVGAPSFASPTDKDTA
jgi:hypothetical protein